MVATKKTSLVDQQIGVRLRARRLLIGMTQEQLAGKLGLTFQQVQKYEKGVNRIGGSRMQQIADVLDVPVSYFFGGDGSAQHNAADEIMLLMTCSGSKEMLEAYSAIESVTTRKAMLSLLQAVAGSNGQRRPARRARAAG